MHKNTRNSLRDNKMLDIGKGEIIKKLQNQSHNLTLDLESLKLCQKNLSYDRDLEEADKNKLVNLLDSMVNRIQDNLEDIVRMINTLHHCNELDDDILKEVDLLNLRYSKLALQTEKVFVSSPLFMELRNQANSNYMPLNEESRVSNMKRTEKSFRDNVGDSPALKEKHNKSFTAYETDNRPYMKDTFNSRINKNISHKRLESLDKARSQRSILKSPKQSREKFVKYKSAFNEMNSEWIDDLLKQFGTEDEMNKIQKLSIHSKAPKGESPTAKQNPQKSSQQTLRKTVFDFPPTGDVIKRELQSLKNLYIDLKEKLDSHSHSDYETQLEKLRYENAKVLSENKILQKDNSELMHTLFEIKKELKDIKEENHKMKREMAKLKSQNNAPVEEPKSFERLSVKKEQPIIEETDKNNSRILINRPKSSAKDDEELAASWVKRRLG